MDPDSIFKFCTPKYVYVRSATLGLMKYSMMLLIFIYVVIYDILYACDHLAPHHANGFGTISLQHPVDDCNDFDNDCHAKWHNVHTLPYCTQYKKEDDRKLAEDKKGGDDKKDEGKDKKGKKDDKIEHPMGHGPAGKDITGAEDDKSDLGKIITKPKTCRYLDRHRLIWKPRPPSEIFIPTRYTQVKQKLDPNCYNPDIHSAIDLKSGKAFRCKTPWLTEWEKEYYVADIENYDLKLASSFNSPNIGMFGVSTSFQGLFAACKTNHPKNVKAECKRAKVPGSEGAIASEDAATLITADELGAPSLKVGPEGRDEISLGDFLKMTPVAQKHEKIFENVLDSKLPSGFGHPNASLRDVGGIILLDVNYMNNGYGRPGLPGLPSSFQIKPITYRYRPYFVPTRHNIQYQLVQQSDTADWRIVDIWYGISIKMQFNGQLVTFTMSKVISSLTSGLVLLSMATTLVTACAAYMLPMCEKYNATMYQMGEDLSDYKNYRNSSKGMKGSLATWINPLGLLTPKEWADAECTSFTSKPLFEYVGKDGQVTANNQITNADVIKLLCMTEIRLSRIDGNDIRMICVDENEKDKNPVFKCFQNLKDKMYKGKD